MQSLSEHLNSKLEQERSGSHHASSSKLLMLGALGVVFGDIGTSPLYALKESFTQTGLAVAPENIYRFLSMIFWLLLIVVTLKYVMVVMKASNKGEGGDFALLALVQRLTRPSPSLFYMTGLLGVMAGSLFYADGVITPAISVLSAIEGIQVVAPSLHTIELPLAMVILICLFLGQRFGTGKVGNLFGPIMLLWFSTLGIFGLLQIVHAPEVMQAVNPLFALKFIITRPFLSFMALGATVLSVTGAEALYADMGHFGAKPIRAVWLAIVWPGLILNYFGQGALLILHPKAIENPFYLLAPKALSVPLLILAAMATVIASQAVISGTFSITKQAIQLGFLPRSHVVHTSEREVGQIYIPFANWLLLLVVAATVLSFGSSGKLASAYGLAVSGTMLVTTLLTFFVIRYCWHYKLTLALGATLLFFLVDVAFRSANVSKFLDGGWFPLASGAVVFVVMSTWQSGRRRMLQTMYESRLRLDAFLESLMRHPPERVPGNAVFLVADKTAVPHSLIHNLKHNKVLHERNVFLTIDIEDIPAVPREERLEFEPLGHECYRAVLHFGFKEDPDVPAALALCAAHGLQLEVMETSFFLSREKVVAAPGRGMSRWRERLFAALVRNSGSIVDYLNIPPNRVIELGTVVEL